MTDVTDRLARERVRAVDRRLTRETDRLYHVLEGFPQEYGTRPELEALRSALESIRADHVRRAEIDELKTNVGHADVDVRKRLDEATGRQGATRLWIAVVVATFGIAFGAMWQNQITSKDVSGQIKTEAPWLSDRTRIEARLARLETANAALTLRLAQVDALDRFFCRTRAPKLPGC